MMMLVVALLVAAAPASADVRVTCPDGTKCDRDANPWDCGCLEKCESGAWVSKGGDCTEATGARIDRLFGDASGPSAADGLGTAILVSIAAIAAYFFPTIVAASRHHANASAIVVLNLLLGWTVLGWIGALVWAASGQDRSAMVTCGACRSRISSLATICPHCRSKQGPAARRSNPAPTTSGPHKPCGWCKQLLAEAAEVCPHCGAIPNAPRPR